MSERTRPRTLAEMRERLDRFYSDEGEAYARSFRPRPDDVFVMTYPKCGTTWTQQIVHGLRTGGSMDFEEISCVVPWVETAHEMGIDLEAQQPEPRAYKTHYNWNDVPKGGRYIIVVREPADTLLSRYKFIGSMFFDPSCVSLEEFAEEDFIGSGRYWDHILSWWERRNDENVLPLAYEDMQQDSRAAIVRIALFIGIEPEPALVDLVARQSSFAFMKAHESQFDDHVLRVILEERLMLPPSPQFTKVNTGKSGNALSPELRAKLDAVWQEKIAGAIGVGSYEELRGEIGDF